MMPASIVDNNNHQTMPPPMTEKLLEKSEKRVGIEFLTEEGDEAPIGVTDGPEDADTLTRRGVEQNRVGILWRYPHGTA